jgi:serine phosphatase RsbU (regulator of sigma subunit)
MLARLLRSLREDWLLYAGVATLFSPIGILIMMLQPKPPGWLLGVVAGAVSGVTALAWMACFQNRRYWLLLIVAPASHLLPQFLITLAARTWIGTVGINMGDTPRRVVLAVLVVVAMSVGFTLLVRYIAQTERRGARAKAELELAASLHSHLVPDLEGSHGPVRYLAKSVASTEMGGDLVHVYQGRGHTDIIIADVSGHGVKAGVVMAMVKAGLAMRGGTQADGSPRPLAAIFDELNAMLEQSIQPGMFVTAGGLRVWHANKDAEHRAEAVVAGHPPIFRLARGATTTEHFESDALPLGLDASQPIMLREVTLPAGDTLMLFTDGLNETIGKDGKQLGLETLAQIFTRAATATTLEATHAAIFSAVRDFGPQSDDRSLVLVRIEPLETPGKPPII